MGVAWKLCENIDPELGLENRVVSELGLENRVGSRQAERRKKSILYRKEQHRSYPGGGKSWDDK